MPLTKTALFVALSFSSGALPAAAQVQQNRVVASKSCREFVQRFYDWYLRQANGPNVSEPPAYRKRKDARVRG